MQRQLVFNSLNKNGDPSIIHFLNLWFSYQPSGRLWNEEETKKQHGAGNKICKLFTSEHFAISNYSSQLANV